MEETLRSGSGERHNLMTNIIKRLVWQQTLMTLDGGKTSTVVTTELLFATPVSYDLPSKCKFKSTLHAQQERTVLICAGRSVSLHCA